MPAYSSSCPKVGRDAQGSTQRQSPSCSQRPFQKLPNEPLTAVSISVDPILQRFSVWLTRLASAAHDAYSERLRQAFMKPWFVRVNIIAIRYRSFEFGMGSITN